MPDLLEEALARAMRTAAGIAPRHDPDLPALVAAEHARRTARRGRLMVAAAAVAVLVVVTGGAVAVDRFRDRSAPPAATGYQDGALVTKAWPDAVRKLPLTLPNGRPYVIVGQLTGGRLLVYSPFAYESFDGLYSWNPDTREMSTVLAPAQLRPKHFLRGVVVGARYVVWGVAYLGSTSSTEIWRAPVGGGPAQLITTFPDDGTGVLAIDGERLIITRYDVGVVTVPISGGTPTVIPGSRGYGVLAWPWLGSPIESGRTPNALTAWNVATGERRPAAGAAALNPGTCSLSWCISSTLSLQVRNRDGSVRWQPAGFGRLRGLAAIQRDRFLVASRDEPEQSGSLMVLDLSARKTVTLVPEPKQRPDGADPGSHNLDRSLVMWADDNAKPTTYYLLDLTKID